MAATLIRVGLAGAAGYTGMELLRLLARHPCARLELATSRTGQGRPVAELFPHLRGVLELELSPPEDERLQQCDLVFFAASSGSAMRQVPALLERGVRVIDLSADFRLRSAEIWEQWYQSEHLCPDLLEQAVYGLPELYRDQIAGASLVANPGCYPTASILALAPFLERDVIDPGHLLVDAKSGVSGAGRQPAAERMYAEVSGSVHAYAVAGHRHHPEICQVLDQLAGEAVSLTFVPHLVPMKRGILVTVYATVRQSEADFQELLTERYAREPFVDVLPAGATLRTGSTTACNVCRIAVERPRDGDVLVVLAAIDNLVKGAAGQAVQNMNLMFGLAEDAGLNAIVPIV